MCNVHLFISIFHTFNGGRRRRDRMVVRFKSTNAISAYQNCWCGFESQSGRGVQDYVIKFVSDFLRFPPPIKLIASIQLKYC